MYVCMCVCVCVCVRACVRACGGRWKDVGYRPDAPGGINAPPKSTRFGVSLPLIFCGAFLGFKREVFALPVATAAIPRQIPRQAWYMHPLIAAVPGGLTVTAPSPSQLVYR